MDAKETIEHYFKEHKLYDETYKIACREIIERYEKANQQQPDLAQLPSSDEMMTEAHKEYNSTEQGWVGFMSACCYIKEYVKSKAKQSPTVTDKEKVYTKDDLHAAIVRTSESRLGKEKDFDKFLIKAEEESWVFHKKEWVKDGYKSRSSMELFEYLNG